MGLKAVEPFMKPTVTLTSVMESNKEKRPVPLIGQAEPMFLVVLTLPV
jgi:hypothetical protein